MVDALMYVKNYIDGLLEFLDQSPQKLNEFSLNVQYILDLHECGQGKTK